MTTDATEKRNNDLRITWDIPGYGQGHGEWFAPEERSRLASYVDAMNQKYGAGTHWIETRA